LLIISSPHVVFAALVVIDVTIVIIATPVSVYNIIIVAPAIFLMLSFRLML
jgi:hypothetical protein